MSPHTIDVTDCSRVFDGTCRARDLRGAFLDG
jgi:hypothetical protein